MRLGALVACALLGAAPGQATDPATAKPHGLALEGEEAERFLRTAEVVERRPIGSGITGSERLTLVDGDRRMRAAWKTVDIFHLGTTRFADGTVEVDFRDSYKFELAAYEIDRLLELGLVPPVVERTIDGRTGALQAWVEGAMTDDERGRRGLVDPDADHWNRQMYDVRLLHQLTYNTDFRNVRNVLVDPDFRIYTIDFSRAFRPLTFLMAEKDLDRFSRRTLERLERLDRARLEERLSRWLFARQISGLLKRRDRIVALARKRIAEKGEAAVLYP